MLKILKGFIPKLRFMFVAIVAIIVLGLFFKDDVAKYKAEAEKAKAEETVRGDSGPRVRSRMEFWVTKDSPSCFKAPRGDVFIVIVGESRDLKRTAPDGTVTHIGRNKTETSPNLKEGDLVCFQLEDGGGPAKMQVVAM